MKERPAGATNRAVPLLLHLGGRGGTLANKKVPTGKHMDVRAHTTYKYREGANSFLREPGLLCLG